MSLQKHDSLITMNLSSRNASLSITSLRKQWVGSLVYVWKESSKTRSTMYVICNPAICAKPYRNDAHNYTNAVNYTRKPPRPVSRSQSQQNLGAEASGVASSPPQAESQLRNTPWIQSSAASLHRQEHTGWPANISPNQVKKRRRREHHMWCALAELRSEHGAPDANLSGVWGGRAREKEGEQAPRSGMGRRRCRKRDPRAPTTNAHVRYEQGRRRTEYKQLNNCDINISPTRE